MCCHQVDKKKFKYARACEKKNRIELSCPIANKNMSVNSNGNTVITKEKEKDKHTHTHTHEIIIITCVCCKFDALFLSSIV